MSPKRSAKLPGYVTSFEVSHSFGVRRGPNVLRTPASSRHKSLWLWKARLSNGSCAQVRSVTHVYTVCLKDKSMSCTVPTILSLNAAVWRSDDSTSPRPSTELDVTLLATGPSPTDCFLAALGFGTLPQPVAPCPQSRISATPRVHARNTWFDVSSCLRDWRLMLRALAMSLDSCHDCSRPCSYSFVMLNAYRAKDNSAHDRCIRRSRLSHAHLRMPLAGTMDTDEAGPSTSATPATAPPPPPPPAEGMEPMDEGPGAGGASSHDVYSYVVTAHRPSAVAQSLTAMLTSPADINLIISKVTRMEIHQLTDGGLKGVADVPIYGRIACMRVRFCWCTPTAPLQE